MGLKILQAVKKERSIKMMIHERLAGWEKPREHGVIHASDLMKDLEFCPREWAFLDLGMAKKKGSFIGTSLRMTFDHGKAVEYNLRNVWLRDVAVGHWKCRACKTIHPTFGKAPKVKCKCGADLWEYDEPRFLSPTSGISGGLDVLVDVGEPKLRIVEVKTMDKDEFKTLAAPLAEHKFRTSLYLRLADESDHSLSERVNIQTAHLLYVSKSFGFKDLTLKEEGVKDSPFSPFKEWIIPRNDALTETAVAKATVLHHWRQTKQGMPCGICINGLTKRAQNCTAVSPCFSGGHQATLTWMEGGKPRHPGKTVVK